MRLVLAEQTDLTLSLFIFFLLISETIRLFWHFVFYQSPMKFVCCLFFFKLFLMIVNLLPTLSGYHSFWLLNLNGLKIYQKITIKMWSA